MQIRWAQYIISLKTNLHHKGESVEHSCKLTFNLYCIFNHVESIFAIKEEKNLLKVSTSLLVVYLSRELRDTLKDS